MNNTVLELLKRLDLRGASENYEAMLNEPSLSQGLSTDELLTQILDAEVNYRFMKRQKYLLTYARLPNPAMLKDILYSDERGSDFRNNVAKLATLEYIREGRNLTIYGATASGKSFLAVALARKACLAGYATVYYTTKDLISELLMLKGTQAYKNKRKSLLSKFLLVLDDFALTPYDAEEQAVLFDILNDRYERKSTIIASQKSPVMWIKEMQGTTLAESVVSRAAHNNYSLTLKGESLRCSFDINFSNENDLI